MCLSGGIDFDSIPDLYVRGRCFHVDRYVVAGDPLTMTQTQVARLGLDQDVN